MAKKGQLGRVVMENMSNLIRETEPKAVLGFFADISEIPRGSYNTKQISDFLANFAKERNLEHFQDEVNNVVIYKTATAGYEDAPVIILQGHMDMVCEKTPNCTKDMSKEGLDLAIDGDWLYAIDTTLGGDDGMAVACMLALLDSKDIPHPALECVFTVDEETGLEGAEALDCSKLKGKMMINIDGEEEGFFFVSCAGGITAEINVPLESVPAKGTAYAIKLDNLLGGHSGIEIGKEHANANVLMGRILAELRAKVSINLVSAVGGRADNVICKQCDAVICSESDQIESILANLQSTISAEYHSSDPNITITCAKAEAKEMLTLESTDKVIDYLLITPNGIQNMSMDIPGLVETSLNMGALAVNSSNLYALYALRSSVETRMDYVCRKLEGAAHSVGGKAEFKLPYPAWEYKAYSPLREKCIEVFEKMYGHSPKVEAVHAGLECGIFAGKIGKDFDAISIGPDIVDVHTPKERISISSTKRFWEYLCKVLAETINM